MKSIIDKINNLDLKSNSFSLTYLIVSIISLLYTMKTVYHYGLKVLIIISILLIVIETVIYLFLRKKMNNNIKLHHLYLILIIIIGSFYIFGFPPSQLPDDKSDYLRGLEVSEFHLTSIKKDKKVGRNYSKNIEKVYQSEDYDDYLNVKDLKLTGKKDFLTFANKSLYAFVCYIPQAIGIGIGRLLSLPIVYQLIFGKICNLILFIVLTYLSIKYIPTKKELIFFICLLPITIQEATSLSADNMTIAAAIALESFIIWAKDTKKVFEKKHYIALSLLVICLSLCKIVYLPLCFLILLIPDKCFNNIKKKITYCTITILLAIVLNLIWLKISTPFLEAFVLGRGSNSSVQLKYILSNPIRYVIVIFNTIDKYIYTYLEQMVGHSLGSFKVSTSYIFVVINLLLLYCLITKKDYKESILNNIEKGFNMIVLIGTVVLIFTSLYLQWTPVYSDFVDGIQGRYFIPLIPLVALPFISKKRKSEELNPLVIIVAIMVNIISIVSIYSMYL